MWCSRRSPGNGSSVRGPRKLTASASELVGISQLGPDLPELGVEAFAESRPQVLRPGAPARPRLRPDLPLDHEHVPRPPMGEGLVVVEQRLAQIEEVTESFPVAKDL